MSADLLLRHVRPMAGAPVDVLVTGGAIARVAAGLAAPAGVPVIDGGGGVLLPGLVDAHMHLDKTFWGLSWRPHEAGPTPLERIENERRPRRGPPRPPHRPAERAGRPGGGPRTPPTPHPTGWGTPGRPPHPGGARAPR